MPSPSPSRVTPGPGDTSRWARPSCSSRLSPPVPALSPSASPALAPPPRYINLFLLRGRCLIFYYYYNEDNYCRPVPCSCLSGATPGPPSALVPPQTWPIKQLPAAPRLLGFIWGGEGTGRGHRGSLGTRGQGARGDAVSGTAGASPRCPTHLSINGEMGGTESTPPQATPPSAGDRQGEPGMRNSGGISQFGGALPSLGNPFPVWECHLPV